MNRAQHQWDNLPLPAGDRLTATYFDPAFLGTGADVRYHGRSVVELIWRPDGRLVAIDRLDPDGQVTRERAKEVLKALQKAYRDCIDEAGNLLHALGTYRESLDEAECRPLAQFDLTLMRLARMVERSQHMLVSDTGALTGVLSTPSTRPLIDAA